MAYGFRGGHPEKKGELKNQGKKTNKDLEGQSSSSGRR